MQLPVSIARLRNRMSAHQFGGNRQSTTGHIGTNRMQYHGRKRLQTIAGHEYGPNTNGAIPTMSIAGQRHIAANHYGTPGHETNTNAILFQLWCDARRNVGATTS